LYEPIGDDHGDNDNSKKVSNHTVDDDDDDDDQDSCAPFLALVDDDR
jgi:hypothetical protein